MSDPVTNVQIEDVLSSIRRLVSEESRTEARQETAKPAPSSDRLVLTPALRVAEPIDEMPDTDVAELVLTEGDEVMVDADDAAPWRDPDATLYGAAQEVGETVEEYFPEDDTAELEELEEEALPAMVLDAQYEVAPDQSDAFHTEVEAEFVADDDPTEEDEVDEDAFIDEGQQDDDVEVLVEDEVAEVVEPDEGEADDIEVDEAVEDTEPLTSKIEALEAVIARTQDQWEPDGESQDAYSGTRVTAMAWEDHMETGDVLEAEEVVDEVVETVAPKVQERVSEASVETEPGDDPAILASDEAVLDEESLRELVADIVREELQGALGERITRNVRKLVRREIHRALTAQELE